MIGSNPMPDINQKASNIAKHQENTTLPVFLIPESLEIAFLENWREFENQ
jgi:hypothetical protein